MLMLYVGQTFLNARRSSTAAYIPNKVGTSLQPCLTPLLYLIGSDSSPSMISLACTFVYNFLITQLSLAGQPSFSKMAKKKLAIYTVKSLGEINKGNMQVLLLLSAFLHYLGQGKKGVDSASVFPVALLGFSQTLELL